MVRSAADRRMLNAIFDRLMRRSIPMPVESIQLRVGRVTEVGFVVSGYRVNQDLVSVYSVDFRNFSSPESNELSVDARRPRRDKKLLRGPRPRPNRLRRRATYRLS